MFSGQFYPFQPIQFMDGLLVPIIGAGAQPATITYVTNVQSTANNTIYTFSGTDIGTAATDRLVVVGVMWEDTVDNSISSATIGGNAASLVVTGNAQTAAGIIALRVSTGTTADIEITLSATAERCSIAVWNITGQISDTPTASGSDASNTADTAKQVDINVNNGGVGIAVLTLNQQGTTVTWTGATERFDEDFIGEVFTRRSGADYSNTGADETPHSFIASFASTNGGLAAASWR